MFTEYQTDGLGDLGENFFKKIIKKVRPVGAAVGGALTLGLIKPKALHITSKSSKRVYKTAGTVGKVVAGGAVVYLAAPIVGPMLKTAGSTLFGFFKKSGMSDAAAQIAANAVVQGKAPIPPGSGLNPDGSVNTASMFGGSWTLIPIVLVGSVLIYVLVDSKGRRK